MKKSMIIAILILSIVFLLIIVMGAAFMFRGLFKPIRQVEGIKGYDTYTSKEVGASWKYPKNWIVSPGAINKDDQAQVMFQGPGTNTNQLPYRVSFVIFKWGTAYAEKFYKVKELKTIDKFRKLSIQISKNYRHARNFKLHFDKKTELANLPANWYKVSIDDASVIEAYGDSINKSLAHSADEEVVVRKGNSFYILSWTFQGDEKYYDKYYEAFLKAKESFRFLDE